MWQNRTWKILPHKLLRLMISTFPHPIYHPWRCGDPNGPRRL
jgi:hypothetical protein